MGTELLSGPSILVFIATVCGGLALLLVVQQQLRRRRRLQLELDRLRNDVALIQAGNIGLGKALMRVQRQLNSLHGSPAETPVDTLGPRAQPEATPEAANDDPAFDHADALLRAGAPLEQVVREARLTRSEVELMNLLRHPGYQVASG